MKTSLALTVTEYRWRKLDPNIRFFLLSIYKYKSLIVGQDLYTVYLHIRNNVDIYSKTGFDAGDIARWFFEDFMDIHNPRNNDVYLEQCRYIYHCFNNFGSSYGYYGNE